MNKVNAAIPPEIGNLVYLQQLDLSHNQFYGGLPTSIYNIRTMTLVSLNSNQLTGVVSSFASDLSVLDLSDNDLSGGVDFISPLVSINSLNISFNNFNGQFFLHFQGRCLS